MNFLSDLLAKLIPNLIKSLFKKELPGMEVGHSNGETEKRLHDKIDETWSDPPSDK